MEYQQNTIIKRLDGSYEITHNGYPYQVVDDDPLFGEVARFYKTLGKTDPRRAVEVAPEIPQISEAERVALRIQELTRLIQYHLDSWARQNGFDTIHTAANYAGVVDPNASPIIQKFIRDGNHAKAMMMQTWAVALQMLGAYQAGELSEPTNEELLAALPILSWDY